MSLKSLLLPLSLIGLLITLGCNSAAKLGGVTVTIAELTPDASAQKLDAKLLYKNENVLSLAVSETTHALYLNGIKIGKTHSKVPVGLPQLGQVTQTLSFSVENQKNLSALLADGGPVAYRIESVLLLEAGEDDEIKIKTASSGTTSVIRAK